MRNDKEIARHYLDTKILGAYETTEVIWQSNSEGVYKRTFDDSQICSEENQYTINRCMDVDGRFFKVHSVFPVNATSTPTEKLLAVIDNDLKK